MMKTKRILAICGIVLLLSLYVLTFVSALMSTDYSQSLFMASIFATLVVPIMIYAYLLIYRVLKNKNTDDNENSNNNSSFPEDLKDKK